MHRSLLDQFSRWSRRAVPQSATAGDVLQISAREIAAAARHQTARSRAAQAFLRRLHVERRLEPRLRFRIRDNRRAVRAYAAMEMSEFEAINGLQAWSNWRTIPRSLRGRAPNRPILALDACCGTGHSTAVLAYYLAPGSQILGLEYNPRFVQVACGRGYFHRRGGTADVRFVSQSVLEPFRDTAGEPIAAQHVDLVNSSGAIGCHFDPSATALFAEEVARVLRPGGLALVDCGPDGTTFADLLRIFSVRGFTLEGWSRSCPFDRFWQVCFRRNA